MKFASNLFFLLYEGEEVKCIFTLALFVSFCTSRTLTTHLVRAKVYPEEERCVGSRKCSGNRHLPRFYGQKCL